MNLQLPKAFKGCYPFRLCTTSYIFPDHMAPNVQRLGPYFDEIELLMFESAPLDVLPSQEEITRLARLAEEFDITYNVHLPIDINPCDKSQGVRQYAIDRLLRVFDLTAPISPMSYTLHMPIAGPLPKQDDITAWQAHALSSLEILLNHGIPGRQMAIETIDYPIDWIEPVVSTLDLSICIDIGHLILYGFDFNDIYRRYADRTKIVHLHGVSEGKDHLSLDVMETEALRRICRVLSGFKETVSIEVFSLKYLRSSLSCLEKSWQAAGLNRLGTSY